MDNCQENYAKSKTMPGKMKFPSFPIKKTIKKKEVKKVEAKTVVKIPVINEAAKKEPENSGKPVKGPVDIKSLNFLAKKRMPGTGPSVPPPVVSAPPPQVNIIDLLDFTAMPKPIPPKVKVVRYKENRLFTVVDEKRKKENERRQSKAAFKRSLRIVNESRSIKRVWRKRTIDMLEYLQKHPKKDPRSISPLVNRELNPNDQIKLMDEIKLIDMERTRPEVMDDILKASNYDEANFLLMRIQFVGPTFLKAEFLFMELQIKLHFGYYDDARFFLDEVCRRPECKNFLTKMVLFLCEEYERVGLDGIRPFRDVIMNKSFQEQREMFAKAVRLRPDRTIYLWLTLLALINDAVRRPLTKLEGTPVLILQHRIVDLAVKTNPKVLLNIKGFWSLGQSFMKTSFAEMTPHRIMLVYNLFIHSCVKEVWSKDYRETVANRKKRKIALRKFMCKYGALPFFVSILRQAHVGHTVLPNNHKVMSLALKELSHLTTFDSRSVRPYFLFFFSAIRIMLPELKSGKLYLPFHGFVVNYPGCKFPKVEVSPFHDIWKGVSKLYGLIKHKKYPVEEVLSAIDQNYQILIVIAHYYSGNYSLIWPMERFFKPNTDNWLQYRIIRLCAELKEGKAFFKDYISLLEFADANGFAHYEYKFTSKVLMEMQNKVHHILPKENLGQWLLFIAPQVLDMCDLKDHKLLMAQLIVSQFEFEKVGMQRLNHAWNRVASVCNQEEISFHNIDEYIFNELLFHKLLILSNKFTTEWDPIEAYENSKRKLRECRVMDHLLNYLIVDSGINC